MQCRPDDHNLTVVMMSVDYILSGSVIVQLVPLDQAEFELELRGNITVDFEFESEPRQGKSCRWWWWCIVLCMAQEASNLNCALVSSRRARSQRKDWAECSPISVGFVCSDRRRNWVKLGKSTPPWEQAVAEPIKMVAFRWLRLGNSNM